MRNPSFIMEQHWTSAHCVYSDGLLSVTATRDKKNKKKTKKQFSPSIGPFNVQELTQLTWLDKEVNQSSALFSGVVVIDLLLAQMALTNINLALVSFVWFRTNATLSHRDRDKIMFVTMGTTSCLSWCAAAGWGMTVSWQSILSAFTTGSPDLSGYDLSWQLNKHVSHTGILSNFRTLAAHKQQTLWFGCFGKTAGNQLPWINQ